MPTIALILFAVFAALGFGWRSWEQRRRTGSTGFRGISRRAGSGTATMVWAQIDMGDSWRIGVDDGETTTLVRTGLFGRVRNPIFSAMLLFGRGLALVTPNIVALTAFALLVGSIEVQVRGVEEPYLLRVHGQAYRDYVATIGRFVPRLGQRHR